MPIVSSLLIGDHVKELANVSSQLPNSMPANAISGNLFLDGLLSFNYSYLIAVFLFYFIKHVKPITLYQFYF